MAIFFLHGDAPWFREPPPGPSSPFVPTRAQLAAITLTEQEAWFLKHNTVQAHKGVWGRDFEEYAGTDPEAQIAFLHGLFEKGALVWEPGEHPEISYLGQVLVGTNRMIVFEVGERRESLPAMLATAAGHDASHLLGPARAVDVEHRAAQPRRCSDGCASQGARIPPNLGELLVGAHEVNVNVDQGADRARLQGDARMSVGRPDERPLRKQSGTRSCGSGRSTPPTRLGTRSSGPVIDPAGSRCRSRAAYGSTRLALDVRSVWTPCGKSSARTGSSSRAAAIQACRAHDTRERLGEADVPPAPEDASVALDLTLGQLDDLLEDRSLQA